MCLIAYRSGNTTGRGSNIPNRVLEYNKRINPDGFGIAWREDGKLLHQKFAPSEYQKFHDLLKKIDKRQEIEYVAHWRKATHGPICEEMSHPFSYEDRKDGEVLVFHNGIISNNPPQGKSDTAHFVNSVLSQISPRWWGNPAYRFLIEESTGWSRFLIMTQHETIRLNQKAWTQQNGIWYSTSPLPSYESNTTGYTVYKGSSSKGTGASGGSSAGTAAASWSAFDTDDDDDDDDSDFLPGLDVSSTDGLYKGWPHMGHLVTPMTEENDLGGNDRYGMATCESCKTMGEYYLIDGKVFIDVAHEDDSPLKVIIPPLKDTSRALVPYAGNAIAPMGADY